MTDLFSFLDLEVKVIKGQRSYGNEDRLNQFVTFYLHVSERYKHKEGLKSLKFSNYFVNLKPIRESTYNTASSATYHSHRQYIATRTQNNAIITK